MPFIQSAAAQTISATPPPASTLHPSFGTPLQLAPDGTNLWVVNPDAGSVAQIDVTARQQKAEIATGGAPWSLAVAPQGDAVFVVDRAGGKLLKIDPATEQIVEALAVGAEPGMVALSPTGQYAYVTLMGAASVVMVATDSLQIVKQSAVAPLPYAIAVTADGDGAASNDRVLVTHLLGFPRPDTTEAADDSRQGQVTILDGCLEKQLGAITLQPDTHGSPNLLASIALFQQQAWVSTVRVMPALPNSLTQTLFAAVATLDLTQMQEDPQAALPLNDQEIFGSPVNDPMAAVPSPDGKRLYVVLGGSDLVEVIDVADPHQPHLIKFLPVSHNPRGIALSSDGKRGFVLNYLARSVTLLDLDALTVTGALSTMVETLPDDVLRGKILFNNATNPKLSRGGWIACASCHPDGGADGVTWIFPDGPRQTPPLWNAAQTLPWHWSAALDEAQDVESTVQDIQHGLGLAPGNDPPLLGAPNAGRSADLDALAAFLAQGIQPPSLAKQADTVSGRALFQTKGCANCHGGAQWTSSHLAGSPGTLDPDGNGMVDAALRNVNTVNPRDLRGAAGFDPPSLLAVGLTAPYLHDGSMPDLTTLLRSGHPTPGLANAPLSATEIAQLVRFLQTIDGATEPIQGKAQ